MSLTKLRVLVTVVFFGITSCKITDIKYCIPYNYGEGLVRKCTEVISQANTAELNFTCVSEFSKSACLRKVYDGEAHLVSLDGGGLYDAWQTYSILPIVSEVTGGSAWYEYYGVAIVNKDFCIENSTTSLAALKKKNACFASYRGDLVGWAAPLATLLQASVASIFNEEPSVSEDAETAAGFFDKICAPSDEGPLNSGGEQKHWDRLCTACKNGCDDSSEYSGYSGALRCLMEGAGDVAFTKHTVIEYAKGGEEAASWATKWADEFMLLCPDGGCKDVDEYESCHWAKAPPHALAGPWFWNDIDTDVDGIGQKVKDALVAASKDDGWVASASDLYAKGIILDGETQELKPVNTTSLRDFMDSDTFDILQLMYYLQRPARFCVTDEQQLAQCNNVIGVLAHYDMASEFSANFTWGCVLMPDTESCMAAIAESWAEMLLVDGDQMYEARTRFSLAPLVSEYYGGEEGKEHYAVAVVNKEFCEKDGTASFLDLRGKNSCSTGYGSSAGWMMPVATLSELGLLKKERENMTVSIDAQSMAEYFDKICAAGVSKHGPYMNNSGLPQAWEPLCSACKMNCSTADSYSSYVGAFRCLLEGAGQVAFTKHTIAANYSRDGDEEENVDWNGKSKDDFRLLCPNGGCKTVDEYKECNLGAVPARAMVVKQSLRHKTELMSLLVKASEDSEVAEKIFDGANKQFWGEDTEKLVPIRGTVKQYLGDAWDKYKELYTGSWLSRPSEPSLASGPTRICIPMNDSDTIAECNKKFKEANDVLNEVMFECVMGNNTVDCMGQVTAGDADWVMLEPRDQYYAISVYGLQPIISESYASRLGGGLAVAVVKSDFCTDGISMKALKGKNTCFTGYDKFAGWHMPLGNLAHNNILPTVFNKTGPDSSVRPDAQSAAAFFGRICAPGKSYNGPVIAEDGSVEYWDELCKGCTDGRCVVENDLFAADDAAPENDVELAAALKCFMEGADVAFTSHYIIEEFAKDGTKPQEWATLKMDEMKLLCPPQYGDGCQPLDEVESCNLGLVPARGIVTRASKTALWSPALYAISDKAIIDPDWLESVKTIGKYQMFSNATVGLSIEAGYQSNWGGLTLGNLEATEEINRPNVTFCVPSHLALELCEEVKDIMNSAQSHVSFDCYTSAGSGSDCAAAIAVKAADFAVMDAHDAYNAVERYKLLPVAAEGEADKQGSDTFAEYAAVAVVRKELCDSKHNVTLQDLRGTSACFTGYRRTAGFVIPVGYLLLKEVMSFVNDDSMIQNDAESVAAFFDNVCAARVVGDGPKMTPDGSGGQWEGMCSSCSGDCNEGDQYYDYAGSVRCLMEGKGDVAFTKHRAPLEYAQDGDGAQSWSSLRKDQMRLMCPDGGCAAVDDWRNCKFADVPAHAAVTRKDFPDVRRLQKALAEIVVDPDFRRAVLNSTSNPFGYLFSTETGSMKPILNAAKYFGDTYKLFKGFAALEDERVVAGRK